MTFGALSVTPALAGKTYKVAGKTYKTMRTMPASFTQSGNASWYGPVFHGRKTANGERFNMNAMTAAHRTLPLGSTIKVTNTRNGKSIIVRVNDRGPFHGNRVLDLSKAAAAKLGFLGQGTAHVKIEPANGAKAAPAAAPAAIFVDLKSFGTEYEAREYLNQTAQHLAGANIRPKISVEKNNYEYTVRMGPFNNQERADEAKTHARTMPQVAI
ncbi:septal ring lytic transglycosylase RlpA family protein [Neisseria animalis]|uniref:Endolytic peptidoglycan transglycosylase RlpA n=1 Tax=Neisseria animalis TaxID=492 RepID=A0A5P3MV75_NEIAN|nr:septal ring lytic transglycosylase RlpA family protein [Neisseria animalis]QEY24975.1 septal ring lytic transglycosylase RlpA family protein [Neisseria animalis]ROW32110.1 septal ring lytic transglycosylase RlpA family protein [Neisseria animalis]